MLKGFCCGVTLFVFVFASSALTAPIPPDGNPVRSLWVEKTPTLDALESEASMDALINFAVAGGVNRLYLATYPYLEPPADPALPWEFRPQLPTFLQKAAAADIEVEALFGAITWADPYNVPADPNNHSDPDWPDYYWNYVWPRKLMTDVIATNAGYESGGGTGFAGIHLDLEYWAYWKDFGAAEKSEYQLAKEANDIATMTEIEENYIAFLNDVHAMTDPAGLRLAIDLPTWMDISGETQRPTQLSDAMDEVDSVNILSYRDIALDVFNISEGELALADAKDLEILLAALTMPPDGTDIKDWNTYFDESQFLMEIELGLTSGMIGDAGYDTFAGFGIYHYETYATMPVPEPGTVTLALISLSALAAFFRKRKTGF
ncbi:MAG: PEP-CTERM sorting domain-containing protein [Planctomycetota bacterium]